MKAKAQAAAEALRRIFPSVQVRSGDGGKAGKGCEGGGKLKAQAAAEALHRFFPAVLVWSGCVEWG